MRLVITNSVFDKSILKRVSLYGMDVNAVRALERFIDRIRGTGSECKAFFRPEDKDRGLETGFCYQMNDMDCEDLIVYLREEGFQVDVD